MKQIDKALRPMGWTALFALILVLGTGCDAGALPPAEATSPNAVAALASMDFVESVEMTVENPGSAKDERFILEIQVNESADIRYPEAFNVLGMRNDGSVTRMVDSGSGVDAQAGDGIFSAYVDRSCLEADTIEQYAGKDIVKFTLTCEIDFVSPGESCEGEGVCPESASRSWLWGLIEYEVDVVTCWCFQGCDVDVEFSLGKDDQYSTNEPIQSL